MDDYNKTYKEAGDIFGKFPEKMLINFVETAVKKGFSLDIGAGQGRNSFYLAEKGFSIDAADSSEVAVEFMRKNNKFSNLNILKSSFENFNSDKNYDLRLIFGLIQILSYNQSLILAEKVSSLSKKGTTVLITSFSEKDDTFNFDKNNFQEYRTNYFVNN